MLDQPAVVMPAEHHGEQLSVRLPVDDEDRVRAALASRYSPRTVRCYRGAWRAWEAWARIRGFAPFPAESVHIAAYLAARAAEGRSVATLSMARAAIRAVHVNRGEADPTAAVIVQGAMGGLRRQIGVAASQAAALTSEALAAIVATAPPTAAGRRDVALVRTMRDGLLRRSETAALTWGDLTPASDGSARLLIRRSKTDPEAGGATVYLAVETRKALAAIRPPDCQPGDPIFGIGARQISRRLAALARRAGLLGAFSGHSPRIGMAQDLAEAGVELPALMSAGRWASSRMPAVYTRNAAAGRGAVAHYYGQRN